MNCKICAHTHEFEKTVYEDCPWCICEKYNGNGETSGLYFRPKRVRAARRRHFREDAKVA